MHGHCVVPNPCTYTRTLLNLARACESVHLAPETPCPKCPRDPHSLVVAYMLDQLISVLSMRIRLDIFRFCRGDRAPRLFRICQIAASTWWHLFGTIVQDEHVTSTLAMTRSQQRVDLCAILSPDWWQRGKLAHLIPNLKLNPRWPEEKIKHTSRRHCYIAIVTCTMCYSCLTHTDVVDPPYCTFVQNRRAESKHHLMGNS